MSTWRTRATNKMFAVACLALPLLAAFPVCAFAFDGIVTPKGAKGREWKNGIPGQTEDMAEQSGSAETDRRAEDGEDVEEPGDEGSAKSAETSGAVASPDGEENSDSGSSTRTAAGAAVLVGAGAYTYVRGRWKEKEKERDDANPSGEKYAYFENHTKAGIEKAEKNAIGNAERTVSKM